MWRGAGPLVGVRGTYAVTLVVSDTDIGTPVTPQDVQVTMTSAYWTRSIGSLRIFTRRLGSAKK